MKAIKYFVAGALMLSIAAPSMAQDVKSQVDAITKVVVDAKGDVVATKAPVKAFMKLNKKNAEALAGLGRAFLAAKNFEQAKVYADQAMKVGKTCAAGYVLRGDIASAEDDGGMAASYYEMATQQAPQDPTAYVKYARVYQKVDPKGAVAMLEKLRTVKPDYPVDAAAGYMYSSNNQLKSAMNYYDKVSNAASLEDYILFDYASTAYVLEQYDKALTLSQTGIQKYPHYGSFNRIALYSSDKQKQYEAAVGYGKQLFAATDTIKYTPNDYIFYADALVNTGNVAAAVEAYKHLPEVDADNKEYNKFIAQAYAKGKMFAEAVAAYEQYLKDKGEEVTYKEYDDFADIYLEEAEAAANAEAKKAAFKKAADIYGLIAEKFDYAAIYAVSKQATAYYQINPDLKVGIALPYYQKLIQLIEAKDDKTAANTKKLATAYQYLAVHYIQNDKVAEAKQWASKLLEVRPDDETGKQIMDLK